MWIPNHNLLSQTLTMLHSDLSMNGMLLHSHAPTHASIYLHMLSSHVQNFIWQFNCMPVCSVSLSQIIHLYLMLSWVSICRNPLYYTVFGSKHISVSNAQKYFKWVQTSSLPIYFLKHSCKQSNFPLNISFISLETE